ncbi:hypothetical protein BJX65DRAFT_288239 [Aspergillus insuetus]
MREVRLDAREDICGGTAVQQHRMRGPDHIGHSHDSAVDVRRPERDNPLRGLARLTRRTVCQVDDCFPLEGRRGLIQGLPDRIVVEEAEDDEVRGCQAIRNGICDLGAFLDEGCRLGGGTVPDGCGVALFDVLGREGFAHCAEAEEGDAGHFE